MLLNTSLLRERFVIQDEKHALEPIVAVGNRLLLPLVSDNGEIKERFVVRAQTMHMALRLAAYIAREFQTKGPILHRQVPLRWDDIWYDMTSEFERLYNPSAWCAIYHNGRAIFKNGNYHPFLDVIEQCDIKNRADYDKAIYIAEDIFKQAGKSVKINHNVNIGVVIGAMEGRIRSGLILRAPAHTSTFNFVIETDYDNPASLRPHDGLDLSSYYLEGIQLAVLTGIAEYQRKRDGAPASHEPIPLQSAYKRLGRLTQAIDSREKQFSIRYRPEKPDFKTILDEARQLSWGVTRVL
mgnify:CR=1 FL=1